MKKYLWGPGDLTRFYSKCGPKTPEGCIPWLGAVDDRGYGKFAIGESCVSAHKFAYLVKMNLQSVEERVAHTCGNKNCVGAGHLVLKPNDGRPQSIDLGKLGDLKKAGVSRAEAAQIMNCSYSSIKRLWCKV